MGKTLLLLCAASLFYVSQLQAQHFNTYEMGKTDGHVNFVETSVAEFVDSDSIALVRFGVGYSSTLLDSAEVEELLGKMERIKAVQPKNSRHRIHWLRVADKVSLVRLFDDNRIFIEVEEADVVASRSYSEIISSHGDTTMVTLEAIRRFQTYQRYNQAFLNRDHFDQAIRLLTQAKNFIIYDLGYGSVGMRD